MNYVAYYRVSSKAQGKSGLGLEAQKHAVEAFLSQNGKMQLYASFIEVESGRKTDRIELKKAIEKCKLIGATLLIAKLDRLARNVKFIFTLKEELEAAGVGFIALDLPEANTLTLGVLAAFAQHEAERISQRTKDALKAAKERGVKLGKPENLTNEARLKGTKNSKRKALENKNVRHAYHFIKPLREDGNTYQSIADQLNAEGYTTSRGKSFHAWQVYNIYKRMSQAHLEA